MMIEYNEIKNIFFSSINEHVEMFNNVIHNKQLVSDVLEASSSIINCFKSGGQLLLCGNGGSAADSQHIAAEFVSRFEIERTALNAEALSVNTSNITAIGNDYSYDKVFSRQVDAKGHKGDILIGISTSGKSINVIKALEHARNMGIYTIGLTGLKPCSDLSKNCDCLIEVPSSRTARIQEAHIFIGHIICEIVEKSIFD